MMHYQRSGHREDRRRRALLDDTCQQEPEEQRVAESSGSTAPQTPKRLYTQDARAESQPRLTDLIPRRRRTLAGLFLLLGLAITAIQFLYLKLYLRADLASYLDLSAMELAGPATLSSWFATMLMLWTGTGCLLVYLHRRHKSDDYRGTYRWWLWTAVVFLFASMDAATGVHRVWESLVERWQRPALLADHPFLATYLGYFLVGAFLFSRVFSDVRRCAAAIVVLTLSLACLLTSAVHHLGQWQSGPIAVVAESTLQLCGLASLGFFVWLVAKHVFLEAHGIVKTPRREKRRKQRSEISESHSQTESDSTNTDRRSRKRNRQQAATAAVADTPADEQPTASKHNQDAEQDDRSAGRQLRIDDAHHTANDLEQELEDEISGRKNRKKRRKKRRKAS